MAATCHNASVAGTPGSGTREEPRPRSAREIRERTRKRPKREHFTTDSTESTDKRRRNGGSETQKFSDPCPPYYKRAKSSFLRRFPLLTRRTGESLGKMIMGKMIRQSHDLGFNHFAVNHFAELFSAALEERARRDGRAPEKRLLFFAVHFGCGRRPRWVIRGGALLPGCISRFVTVQVGFLAQGS